MENRLRVLELKESRPAQVPQFKGELFYETETESSAIGQEQGTSEFNGSFTPMVANVNSVKTEQPANDYKLFLRICQSSTVKAMSITLSHALKIV